MCTNLTVSEVDAVEASQYISVIDFNVKIFTLLLMLNTSRFWIRIRMVRGKVQTSGNPPSTPDRGKTFPLRLVPG